MEFDTADIHNSRDVYWEVSEDLPKTTKIIVDGKACIFFLDYGNDRTTWSERVRVIG